MEKPRPRAGKRNMKVKSRANTLKKVKTVVIHIQMIP